MKILVDTHYLLWITNNPEKLTDKEKELLTSPKNEICCSSISLWEISLKYALGKLTIGKATPEDIYNYLSKQPITIIEPDKREYATFNNLSLKENHRDPFDRMLIWQAINNQLVMMSRDRKFEQYREEGLLLK